MSAQKTSVQKVLKKLSAMRVTLPADEQEVLDDVVLATSRRVELEEVEAHRMSIDANTQGPLGDIIMGDIIMKTMPRTGIQVGLDTETGEYFEK